MGNISDKVMQKTKTHI